MNILPDELQRLLAEEPFVRALAKSLVADEADDVVQQAWVRAMAQRPASVREPRAWLARIVRNLVADRRRRAASAVRTRSASATHALVPSSAELAESEEMRRRLVGAVDALPEPLRTVVLLRYFEGLPPRRIAKDLGVPVSVVWNRLHAALVALRQRLDAAHGGSRRAWLVPLMPFAASPRTLPWLEVASPAVPSLALGVITMTMTTKTKLAAVATVLLAAVLVWTTLPNPASPPPDAKLDARVEPGAAVLAEKPSNVGGAATSPRESLPAPAAATTGDLVVTVRHAQEPTNAAGRTVLLRRRGGDLRVGVLRAETDAQGVARFPGLAPGEVRARVAGSWGGANATITAGQAMACEIVLRGAMTLTGVVVDAAGVPIGGALVETGPLLASEADIELVAVTAADGSFTLRECGPHCFVGARATGFAASQLHYRGNGREEPEPLRIELRALGGSLDGFVVDANGAPLVDAVVRVGQGDGDDVRATPQGAPPLPAQVVTDTAGHFTAIGLPVGKQPLLVRAAGCAPWIGECEIAALATTAARVVMQPEVTCRGRVTKHGQPLEGVSVRHQAASDFLRIATTTNADGTYELRGLPRGDFELKAEKDRVGCATARVHGEPGVPMRCDFEVSNGLELRGHVFDAAGAPVPNLWLQFRAEGDGEPWLQFATTDVAGAFLVVHCPPGRTLALEATLPEHLPWRRSAIDPNAGELEIRFAKDSATKARITGRLLRPDGSGAKGLTVESWRQNPRASVDVDVVSPDGAFVLEVPAGTWLVRVIANGHPQIRIDGIELQPGAAVDLGVLQLVRGGTLVVHDDPAMKCVYDVFDTHDRYVAYVSSPAPPVRSDLLPPGDYRLHVRPQGSAPQVLPFSITAERDTVLTVKPVPGVRRRIEFVPAAGATVRAVSYEIRQAGARVMGNYVEAKTADELAQDVWLVPGEYELTTTRPAPKVTVAFTIAEAMREPLRVQLR